MDGQKTPHGDLMEQTLLTTPKPRACSTDKKPRTNKNILQQKPQNLQYTGTTRESLGVLNMDDIDLTPSLERPRNPSDLNNSSVSEELQKQRELAKSMISRMGLPSMYMKSMIKSDKKPRKHSDSTIDDNDLLSNISAGSLFHPNDISTPRTSGVLNVTDAVQRNTCNVSNIAANISVMSNKIKYTDISLKELCEQYGQLLKPDESRGSETANSEMFVSSPDLAAQVILHDEQEWRDERDMPQQHDSIASSVLNSTTLDEVHSMGEFFKLKSEDCSNIFLKESPEKTENARALISNTTLPSFGETSQSNKSDNRLSIATPTLSYNAPKPRDSSINMSDISRLLSNETKSPLSLIEALLNSRKTNEVPTNPVETFRTPSPRNTSTYTDTFASTKLCTTGYVSSCKTSMEDLSDKENVGIVRNNSPSGSSANRSLSSVRSVSSLDTLIDGKLPIESTRVELVWTTVRVGKSSHQDFVIRNKINQKIRFQILVTGTCFKLPKSDSESQTCTNVVLHPFESRSVTIAFTPTSVGAQCERIHFLPVTKTQPIKPTQKILLFGYGGHIQTDICGALKDSTAKYWVTLGGVEDSGDVVTKEVGITNSGTLASFVHFVVSLRHLQMFTSLKIRPEVDSIPPGKTRSFLITYTPNKEDLQRLKNIVTANSNVCDIAVIKCIYGPEVVRGRIRRIVRKLRAQDTPVEPFIERLTQPFPAENIPKDVGRITEGVSSLRHLIHQLDNRELIVTVEQDLDKTIMPGHNESSTFQTLCFDRSDINSVLHIGEETFNVEPKTLVLSPSMKRSDVLFLINNSDRRLSYEIRVNKDLVQVNPRSGVIAANGTSTVQVVCNDKLALCRNEKLILTVFSEHTTLEIDVQLMYVHIPS